MKKKNLYILIAALMIKGIVSSAQTNISSGSGEHVSLGAPEKIVSADGRYYMSPVWSPDGKYVAYTGSNYKGIWVKDLTTGKIEQITSEDAAGFGFEWLPDSKVILSRVAKYEGMKRYNAVKLFFVETREEKLLTDYRTFMPGLPHWSSNGEKVYLFDGKKLNVLESGISAAALKKISTRQKIVYSKNSEIYIGESAAQNFNSFKPFSDKEYLNITTSPDGLKIAFEVYGGNLYVMNSDGSGLVDLGKGYRPKWSPDSKRIAYMITEDDGDNYTSSDLYMVKADGTDKIQLTKTEGALEMNPSWSPDGKFIAYNEMNEGSIYLLPVNIQ